MNMKFKSEIKFKLIGMGKEIVRDRGNFRLRYDFER